MECTGDDKPRSRGGTLKVSRNSRVLVPAYFLIKQKQFQLAQVSFRDFFQPTHAPGSTGRCQAADCTRQRGSSRHARGVPREDLYLSIIFHILQGFLTGTLLYQLHTNFNSCNNLNLFHQYNKSLYLLYTRCWFQSL